MFALGRRPTVDRERHRGADSGVVASRPIDRVRLLQKSSLREAGRHGHICESSTEEEEEVEEEEDDGGAGAVAQWSTLNRLRSDMSDRVRRAEPGLDVPEASAVFAAKLQGGRVAALPVYYEDPRQAKKSKAGSVKATGLQVWLSSAEGKEWQEAKRRRNGEG